MTASVSMQIPSVQVLTQFELPIQLLDYSTPQIVKVSPTIEAGDAVLWRKASGTWTKIGNLSTLPELYAGETTIVKLIVTAAEIPVGTQAISVVFSDQTSPATWCVQELIFPVEQEVAVGTSDLTAAQIASSALFSGITSLANWLRAALRKDTAEATAKSEINNGGGAYNEATDSLEAARDNIGTAGAGLTGIADPLVNEVPGEYESGSAGAALGKIGKGTISTVAPTAQNGDVTTYQGGSYVTALGTALEWTDREGCWPDLTDATIQTLVEGGPTFTGEVVTPTGDGKTVRQQLEAEDSVLVDVGHPQFQVWAVWAEDEELGIPERSFPLVKGKWVSNGKVTPAAVES